MAVSVGLLHYTAPPIIGGVESVLAEHARLLAAAGHRVRVIAGRGGTTDAGWEAIRIPLADSRHPRIVAARSALDAGEVPEAFDDLTTELVRQLQPAIADLDVLIAHNVCSLHFNLPLTAATHRLVEAADAPRLVAWQHDLAWSSMAYAEQLHPGFPWDLLRTPWPRTTYVAISEARRAEQARISGLPLEAIRVIPNGIDVARFVGLHPTTTRLLDELGLAGAGPVMLVPVRITPRKNLELAIRILAELRRGGDDARLIVTGPPDPHEAPGNGYVGRLRALAATTGTTGAVHLLAADGGRATSIRVVRDLYRVADLLLLPSHDEGFGLPILEAATTRLPIVCADIPSLRELAGDDATYLRPDADPAEVARSIRHRLSAEMATRLASRVRGTYGWPRIYEDRIEPLIVEVAGASR